MLPESIAVIADMDSNVAKTSEKSLYNFQWRSVRALLSGKHIVIATTGSGKGPTSVVWSYFVAKRTHKQKILVITTSSKVHVTDSLKRNDFEAEMDEFCPTGFRKSITLETVSWDLLYKWVGNHSRELGQWIIIADEITKMSGHTTRRGKAFLKLVECNKDWAGFTATPGDTWSKFSAYFHACGLIKNKTEFVRRFCKIQTFKGFPEIVGYNEEDTLKRWWKRVSYAPNTAQVTTELPAETHKTIPFRCPTGYRQVLKTRKYENKLINTPSKLTSILRQLCFSKEKKQWVSDFLEAINEPVLMFYNFIKTGDELEVIAKKVLPKEAKVWRIDGAHHEVPTAETIGPRDIVLAQWQSGAEGLNLQMMRLEVFVEPTYAYSTYYQAQGRIRRIGQKRAMFYYSLVCEKSIDRDVYKCLEDKQSFAEDVWLIGKGLIQVIDKKA